MGGSREDVLPGGAIADTSGEDLLYSVIFLLCWGQRGHFRYCPCGTPHGDDPATIANWRLDKQLPL